MRRAPVAAMVVSVVSVVTALSLSAFDAPAGGSVSAATRGTPPRAMQPTTLSSVTTAAASTPPYAANRRATVTVRLRHAVRGLPVARQTPLGYDRDKFGDWRDADGDCRDTRAEVLRAESRRPVTGRCTVVRGRWFSAYDHRFWRNAGDVDIDHVVPLFEVWRSGGKRWGSARRIAYANDLADPRTLRAVTDNVNQSKGDSDPARWLPEFGHCSYVAQYAAIKIRWSLLVDATEKRAMKAVASHCRNVMIRVHKARVVTGGGGSGTDPRFDTCAEAIAHGYGPYRRGRDPEYAWYTDADDDGWVCES